MVLFAWSFIFLIHYFILSFLFQFYKLVLRACDIICHAIFGFCFLSYELKILQLCLTILLVFSLLLLAFLNCYFWGDKLGNWYRPLSLQFGEASLANNSLLKVYHLVVILYILLWSFSLFYSSHCIFNIFIQLTARCLRKISIWIILWITDFNYFVILFIF